MKKECAKVMSISKRAVKQLTPIPHPATHTINEYPKHSQPKARHRIQLLTILNEFVDGDTDELQFQVLTIAIARVWNAVLVRFVGKVVSQRARNPMRKNEGAGSQEQADGAVDTAKVLEAEHFG